MNWHMFYAELDRLGPITDPTVAETEAVRRMVADQPDAPTLLEAIFGRPA